MRGQPHDCKAFPSGKNSLTLSPAALVLWTEDWGLAEGDSVEGPSHPDRGWSRRVGQHVCLAANDLCGIS